MKFLTNPPFSRPSFHESLCTILVVSSSHSICLFRVGRRDKKLESNWQADSRSLRTYFFFCNVARQFGLYSFRFFSSVERCRSIDQKPCVIFPPRVILNFSRPQNHSISAFEWAFIDFSTFIEMTQKVKMAFCYIACYVLWHHHTGTF